jgi:hypothetical protein
MMMCFFCSDHELMSSSVPSGSLAHFPVARCWNVLSNYLMVYCRKSGRVRRTVVPDANSDEGGKSLPFRAGYLFMDDGHGHQHGESAHQQLGTAGASHSNKVSHSSTQESERRAEAERSPTINITGTK